MIITNGYAVLVFFGLAIIAMISLIVIRKGTGIFHDSEFGEECSHEVKPAEPSAVQVSNIKNVVNLNERANTASGVTYSQYNAWKRRTGSHDVSFSNYVKIRNSRNAKS